MSWWPRFQPLVACRYLIAPDESELLLLAFALQRHDFCLCAALLCACTSLWRCMLAVRSLVVALEWQARALIRAQCNVAVAFALRRLCARRARR